MIAVDLLAYAQTLLLHDTPLARVEPKTLRPGCCTSPAGSPAEAAASGSALTCWTAIKDACLGCHAAAGRVGRV
jgi:hypothetical protein